MTAATATRLALAKGLVALRTFLVKELQARIYFWDAQGFNLADSPTTLQQNGVDIAVDIAFPASGRVQWTVDMTLQPAANNSGVYVAMQKDGAGPSIHLFAVGEGKGRRSATYVLVDQPFTTHTYKLAGFHYGGGSGIWVPANEGGNAIVLTLQPVA